MAGGVRPYAQPLSALVATEAAYAGGKGAALARLFQAGLPVPPGCVLSPDACAAFLAAQHLPSTCSTEEIHQALLTAPLPLELVADVQVALASTGAAPHG